jgi:hypothetical protein
MHSTLPHLQSAIRQALQKGPVCRVYPESLNACWPNLPDEEQLNRIERFAAQNHWRASIRILGNLGAVAEFSKAEDAQHAA